MTGRSAGEGEPRLDLIAAPSNLGLRPPSPGREPGTWRAPHALLSAGLASRLAPVRTVELARPPYDFERQPGTGIRNGRTIREHALMLADAIEAGLSAGRFAVVLGGDCSLLLGCLVGARRGGRCGLVHVDGHSDFFHPGNYDVESRLGSAAGMDLALATGRGEPLLTRWPDVGTPLVADDDTIQIGDREAEEARATGGAALDPSITQFTIQETLRRGVAEVCQSVVERLEQRGLDRVWLHVDLDVLDQGVLPAVDSPGSPGLDFAQLADVLSRLVGTGRVIGLDVTIYDPELDPGGEFLPGIVDCLARGLGGPSTAYGRPRRDSVPTGGGREELAAALLAGGPHVSLGDQARVFDRFVGTWDCEYTHFSADGQITERYPGEVTFGWIIDGWAMQDVWIGYRQDDESARRSIGTTIRYLDPASGLWNVVWFAPEGGVRTTVVGGAQGDRIVLEGETRDGARRRWSFNDIRQDSFVWRGEHSDDGGRTWYLAADYRMRRRSGARRDRSG